MIYFANPTASPAVHRAMSAGLVGLIDTPHQGSRAACRMVREAGAVWCADNGAFTDRWTADHWWSWLTAPDQAGHAGTCAFAVAPDVVGDAAATAEKAGPWLQKIRALGYPVAYVAQNGIADTEVPWPAIDVLFIGGDDAFKLGPEGRAAVADAKRRGKRVHLGRVNSDKRFRFAQAIGCDSVDGTFLRFGPDRRLPELLGWLQWRHQTSLF